MAGLGQEAVVPIRPDLATNLQPINFAVEQNAVAAVSQAFRDGQISYNDIAERYGALAKGKEKKQIVELDEFLNPDAIESRKNQTALLGEKAKSELSLLPVEQQAKEAVAIETKIKADQGDNAAIRKFAIDAGLGGKLSPYASIDPVHDAGIYKMAARYATTTKAAKAIGTDVDRRQSVVENAGVNEKGNTFSSTVKDPNKDILASKTSAVVYTQDQAARAKVLGDMTAEEFVDAGSPSVAQYVFGIDPAVTARPGTAAPSVAPVADLVTPRQTIKTTVTKPDGSTTVTEKVIESTEHPAPPATPRDEAVYGKSPWPDAVGPSTGGTAPVMPEVVARSPYETSYKETPIESKIKQPTEAQQRAQTAVQKFAQSGRMEDAIAGYDPTTYSSWIAGLMPNFLRFGAQSRQTFEAARGLWQQGLLRMESGAAISPSEQVWYNTTFFPELNDPPALVEAKGNARRGVEDTVAEIAQAGGVISPESVHAAWDLKQRRAGSATSSQPTSGKVSEVSPGKKLFLGTDGQYHYVK